MAQKQVIDKIKLYLTKLKDCNINVYKAFIYGSYAAGTNDENSDIDVAIISEDLGKNYLQEMRLLMKLTRDIDLMIAPDPYSLEDYNNASRGDFLWQEVIEKGLPILL